MIRKGKGGKVYAGSPVSRKEIRGDTLPHPRMSGGGEGVVEKGERFSFHSFPQMPSFPASASPNIPIPQRASLILHGRSPRVTPKLPPESLFPINSSAACS